MDIKYRRIIVGFFALCFFITAPIVVIYTSGYRVNLKHFTFTKTGNIFIESPDLTGAHIYINGELHDKELNKKIFINDVLPGNYTLEVTKDNRYPWKKQIEVSEGITTFIKDVILFANTKPILTVEHKVTDITPSHSRELMILTVQNEDITEYYLFNTTNNESSLIYRSTQNSNDTILWSPNDDYILFTADGEDKGVVIKVKDSTLTTLPLSPTRYQWNTSNEKLFTFSSSEVVQYDISNKKTTSLYQTPINTSLADVKLDGDRLYTVEKSLGGTKVYSHQLLLKVSSLLYETTSNNNFTLEHITPDFLTLINTTSHTIELVKFQEKSSISLSHSTITLNAISSIFSPDSSLLLYFSEYEINVIDTTTLSNKLIDRLSTPLLSVYWYNDNEHIIIVKNNEIILSDLRTNSSLQQTTPSINMTSIFDTHLLDESLLYIAGEKDSIQGLYTLVLQ